MIYSVETLITDVISPEISNLNFLGRILVRSLGKTNIIIFPKTNQKNH